MISCGFIGVYRADKRLRAYQFGYVGVSRDEQVLLPCQPAFSLQERDNWILTHDQVRDIVAQHQPEPEEGGEEEEEEQHEQYNAAWEGHHQQQQGGGAWDPWPNQPQQQHGNNYVPYNEFLQLTQRVGEIDNTLHGVDEDIGALTNSFNHFMNNFPNFYQQYPQQPPHGGNN